MLAVLRSARFVDCSPAQVYFTLLDEGIYLASESSYYRLLRANGEVRERRRQATHPAKVKPELVADRAARRVVLGHHQAQGPKARRVLRPLRRARHLQPLRRGLVRGAPESGELAKELIADAVARHQVPPGQLTIHADRGSSMTSNPVAELLTFLGIGRSHSRPHVSNDNPYSRGAVQDAQVLPGLPRALRLASRTPGRSARRSSPTTTTSTATRASATTRPPRCTTAPRTEVRAQRAETLDAAYAANPRPVPPPSAAAAEAADRGLDQRACAVEELAQKAS